MNSGGWNIQDSITSNWNQQPFQTSTRQENYNSIAEYSQDLNNYVMTGPTPHEGNPHNDAVHSNEKPQLSSPDMSSTSVSSGEDTEMGGQDENRDLELRRTIEMGLHPRDNLSPWRWKALLLSNALLSLISGYDVSNVANIQAPIYEAFGYIEILPWVALSYSVCNVATIPLARRLYQFCDFKALAVASMVLIIAGTALAGAAPNLNCLIAGRAIMAVGASIIYQGILCFNTMFAHPHELALVQAGVGGLFAIGLITGPVIGGAFASSPHATWRWAFFFALPLLGLSLASQLLCLPRYRAPSPTKPLSTHLRETDWLGALLHLSTVLLFSSAALFPGSVWPWGAGSSVGLWAAAGVAALAYAAQQACCLLTTPAQRIFPASALRGPLLRAALCSFGGSAAYGAALYYGPLLYAFAHGRGPLEAAVRILPLVGMYVFGVVAAGVLLPLVRVYKPFYVVGGAGLLVGGGLLHVITPATSEAAVMGFQAVVGLAVGITSQLAVPVGAALLPGVQERFDVAAVHNMAQLGGVAVALSVAGAVYQNVGLQLLKSAIPFVDFTDDEYRELLAGASSPILSGASPEVMGLAVGAIIDVIVRIFYIILAAGAVSFIAACFMKYEALDFRQFPKSDEKAAEEAEVQPV
ncbi:major facilitator superfamily transporter [Camillea tinctor]|nr:major facilitator superfamily transporter [Camillea tinctor]